MRLVLSLFLAIALVLPALGPAAEPPPQPVPPALDGEPPPPDARGPGWKEGKKKGLKKAEKAEKGAKALPAPGNRERWETLSPAEREKLREIYRRLQAMPPVERSRLLEKLRGMAPDERREAVEKARARVREQREVLKAAGKGAKKDAEGAPAPAKKRIRGGATTPKTAATPADSRRLLDAVERWRQGLPFDLRERTRFFTREERIGLFRSYRESEILTRTYQEEAERAFLLALPQERLRGLFTPETTSRPEGISEASWERWRSLRPSARKVVLRRLEKLRQERD